MPDDKSNDPRPALLLDVMSTLVVDPIFTTGPRYLGAEHPRALLGRLSHEAWVDFELGRIDEATYFTRWITDLPPGTTPAGFKAAMAEGYRWIDGIEALLIELREAGAEMHALSNYPAWYRMIEERLALSRYLSWSFVSCRTGVRKPDAEAYLGAARAIGRPPGECLFVDDRQSNVDAARAVGMRALRFSDAAGLRAGLVEHGVLGARGGS